MYLPPTVDLSMASAVWVRNLAVYAHTWRMNILPNFFEPVLYLVGMGVGLGAYLRSGMGASNDYVAFIAPGLLAASAMNGSSFEASYNMFVKMNFAKLYDAFLTTPAEIEDIGFGELMWAVTRSLIYGLAFLVILVAMTAVGFPILTTPWAIALPLALVVIGTLFGLMGQLFTAHITVIDLYSYYFTLFLTPLFLFSGIFFPVDRFGAWGEKVAWCTPLYHAVRMCRGLAQGPVDSATLISTLWMVVACAVLMWAVPRQLRRRFWR